MHINVLVEGIIDEAVARRLINETGHQPGVCYGKKGVSYIHQKIRGFNKSAASMPILTLVDFMDTGLKCPPEVTSSWLPHRCANMLCRIVVREIESWILADRNNLSTYLRVASNRVPLDPENVDDPKQILVNIARHSSSRTIRESIVPSNNSGANVGPLYNSVFSDFVGSIWKPSEARLTSYSLDRCMTRLAELTD